MRRGANRLCRTYRKPNFLHDPVDTDGMPHQVKDRTTPFAPLKARISG
jgi:hypothetical protein